ncbi:helix-turn-helix transcriptional regulator [Streptomyces sp. NPDC020801]|uniref:helix-turn-helix domain-containing protein n=1 Tax=unclassified Streptomyces TaxID=2593676 RepID=UPI00379CEE36
MTPVGEGRDRTARLSPRELEILLLVAHGMSDSEISVALSISPRTVGAHLSKIREKLCAKNRTHLVARALRARLLAIRTEQASPAQGDDTEKTFDLTGRTGVVGSWSSDLADATRAAGAAAEQLEG